MLIAGSHKLSGNRIPGRWARHEKARRPNVRSRYRGTSWKRRVTDRKCSLDVTSETGRLRFIKYCDAWPCRQPYVMTPVCTRLVPAHRASEALNGEAATSIGRTCGYRKPHKRQHLTPAAIFRSLLSGSVTIVDA